LHRASKRFVKEEPTISTMTKTLYTADATVTGGRLEGHAVSSDGNLDVQIRVPAELGGPGEGTNPEQLFAAGFAACFESALTLVARRKKLEAGDATVVARVGLHPTEERGFKLSVEMDVSMPSVDDAETAADLVRTAHKVCPYSHATRGNIDVILTANGAAVE
jgi:Ohr subfamily peroxiredoxin